MFGLATLTPGTIGFAGSNASLRFLKREPVEIAIESLGVPRRASVAEFFRFGPFTLVIPIETRGATLEWAVHSMRVDWALERLRVTDAL